MALNDQMSVSPPAAFAPPKVSIIITTLNCAESLQATLKSIQNQTYKNVECIVIDGGSTDNTLAIIEAFSVYIAYWISENDHGIYHAMNKGTQKATGEWLCYLGAGDFFMADNALANAAAQLTHIPETVKVAYSPVIRFLPNKDVLDIIGLPWHQARKCIKSWLCICHQGIFHHRSLFQEYGDYDESFKIDGDYDLLLRYLTQADPVYIDFPIVAKEFAGITTKPKYAWVNLQERILARRNNGIGIPAHQLYREYIKTFLDTMLMLLPDPHMRQFLINLYRRVVGRTLHIKTPSKIG